MKKFKPEKSQIILVAASVCLLLFIIIAGPKSDKYKKKSYTAMKIAIASDTHYISPLLTDGGEYFTNMINRGDGKAMMYCEEITDAFVEKMKEEKPDYLIVSGDLSFNGAKQSHIDFAKKLSQIKESGVKVLVIPGNHDIKYPDAASFSGNSFERVANVSGAEFAEIYSDFGYADAMSRDEASLSYTYRLSDDLMVILVDVNTEDFPGTLKYDTLDWAREQLEKAKAEGLGVIAVSHQNVLPHNKLFTYGFVLVGAEELVKLYEEYGVICNLSGHMHLQHTMESENGFKEIAQSSLVTAPNHYGIIDTEKMTYHAERLEFPHAKEAEEFFVANAKRGAVRSLGQDEPELTDYYANVNYAYFSGRTDLIKWDEDMYQKVLSKRPYNASYLLNIKEEGFKDHTKMDLFK